MGIEIQITTENFKLTIFILIHLIIKLVYEDTYL